jgi:hypothetical protein
MNGGTINGNTTSVRGGGVLVSGTFTMNGGTISDNTVNSYGGGVYLSSGTFIMNGGTISDNTASGNSRGGGGGVWVDTASTFTKAPASGSSTSGIIYGNDQTGANASLNNTDINGGGAAVYWPGNSSKTTNTTLGPSNTW